MGLPTMSELKAKPLYSVGFGLLGLVDTGLVGMAMDYGLGKVEQIPEWGRDAGRIIGKIAVGTLMSHGVSKITHNQSYGKIHQLGVYINTTLDVIGICLKYGQRMLGETKFKVSGGGYKAPINFQHPVRLAGTILGFGSILGAWDERKLVQALRADGLVVAEGENGQLAIANATDGAILLSGSPSSMAPVIKSVKGFVIGSETGEVGEDISIES